MLGDPPPTLGDPPPTLGDPPLTLGEGRLLYKKGAARLCWPPLYLYNSILLRGGFIFTALPILMAKARIPVPNLKDPLGVLNLTAAIAAGITKAGKDSLLAGTLATELQAAAAKVPAALAMHQRAKDLGKEIEKLYEQRDAVVAECLPLVQRGSKSLQGSLGTDQLRQMGDYGYTVDDSPRPPKAKV